MSFTSSGVALYKILIMMERVQTDLPEPVVPAMMTWGIFAISPSIILPVISFPTANVSLLFESLNSGEDIISRRVTMSFAVFGISMPTAALPGTGASIRTPCAARLRAISSSSPFIFDTFIPGPGCIS